MKKIIKARERETVIQSLKSGVVPRLGLQHIQVGRSGELKSFINDIDTIASGGTSFRFVIGDSECLNNFKSFCNFEFFLSL